MSSTMTLSSSRQTNNTSILAYQSMCNDKSFYKIAALISIRRHHTFHLIRTNNIRNCMVHMIRCEALENELAARSVTRPAHNKDTNHFHLHPKSRNTNSPNQDQNKSMDSQNHFHLLLNKSRNSRNQWMTNV